MAVLEYLTKIYFLGCGHIKRIILKKNKHMLNIGPDEKERGLK